MFKEKRALSNHINLPTCPGEILFQFLSRAEPQFSMLCLNLVRSIPSDSDSEESACKAGDPSSIPRMQRSTGEGNGYPLQYLSWRNSVPFLIQSKATILNTLLRREPRVSCLNPGKPSRDLLQHVSRPDSPTMAREQ